MKRWATIVFNFIYLLAVTGVVMQGHCHCSKMMMTSNNHAVESCMMNETHTDSNSCCSVECCDSENNTNDCDGQPKIQKVDDYQIKTNFFYFQSIGLTNLSHLCFHCFYPQNLEKQKETPRYIFPQPRGIPLYKLYGNFRFYG